MSSWTYTLDADRIYLINGVTLVVQRIATGDELTYDLSTFDWQFIFPRTCECADRNKDVCIRRHYTTYAPIRCQLFMYGLNLHFSIQVHGNFIYSLVYTGHVSVIRIDRMRQTVRQCRLEGSPIHTESTLDVIGDRVVVITNFKLFILDLELNTMRESIKGIECPMIISDKCILGGMLPNISLIYLDNLNCILTRQKIYVRITPPSDYYSGVLITKRPGEMQIVTSWGLVDLMSGSKPITALPESTYATFVDVNLLCILGGSFTLIDLRSFRQNSTKLQLAQRYPITHSRRIISSDHYDVNLFV